MTITRVKLENFTVFESLDLEPSPGINVLLGANGTGKTHLMKLCYAVLASGNNPATMTFTTDCEVAFYHTTEVCSQID